MRFGICIYKAAPADTDLVEGEHYMMVTVENREVILSAAQAREAAVALVEGANFIDPVN